MILKDKVAVVTGGASGIGAETVRAFTKEGAHVVIADVNLDLASQVASELGSSASVVKADVSDVASIRSAVDQIIRAHSHIDILVNSAGVVLKCDFLDVEPEQFDRVIGINLRGTYFFGQAAARTMVGRGGRIINIGSIAGILGFDTRSVYGSSKAAVLQLTRVMASELARHSIIVNSIAPGPVETPLVAAAYDQDFRSRVLARVPMERFAQPDEIARAALYLASPTSSYITGQVLTIDGGYSIAGLSIP
jgi:NAD(P)-dependent dehydrogenase (short-subunit alcohol dehydrogenase family)